MLEDKPEAPEGAGAPQGESSASGESTPEAANQGGGGMLGRWRAGVTPQGAPFGHDKPLWRRILVGVAKWSAIAIFGFFSLSIAAAFAIGWIGPPPTFNMAGVAMKGIDVRSTWVDLKDISPHLVRAVIATEDQEFCTHDGFDREEIEKALKDAERGRRVRGASTISQQTAKNVFLWNGGGWFRKGVEVYFTFLIENMWSKARIMEVYLNVAEWGDGIFGVEQAAQERFGVSAKNLTPRQAAALAAVLPNPNRIRIDGPYATGRRNTQVQSLMGMVKRDNLADCVVGP